MFYIFIHLSLTLKVAKFKQLREPVSLQLQINIFNVRSAVGSNISSKMLLLPSFHAILNLAKYFNPTTVGSVWLRSRNNSLWNYTCNICEVFQILVVGQYEGRKTFQTNIELWRRLAKLCTTKFYKSSLSSGHSDFSDWERNNAHSMVDAAF